MFLRTEGRRGYGGCFAFAFTIACTTVGPTFAQGPEAKAQLEAVFKDWQYRQSIFKSARYALDGSIEYKDEKLPAGNPIRPYRVTLLLDLEKKRYRMEGSQEDIYVNGKEHDPKAWEYRKFISTSAYDGKELQSLAHRKANRITQEVPDLSIGKGDLGPGAFLGVELWPIFFAHGIIPTVHAPLLVDKLPLTHDPDDFDIAGRQVLHGQNCLIARTEPLPGMSPLSDEFWIDTSHKSTIPRHVYFSGSEPFYYLDVVWRNAAYGWWVDRWSKTWSTHGHVRRIVRFRVEAFEANPKVSDSDFKLPAEPGMTVEISESPPPGKGLNPFLAATKKYRISSSGSWDEISAKGFTTLEGKELPPERNLRWIAWIIGSGAAIGALLFYVVIRRRRKISAL